MPDNPYYRDWREVFKWPKIGERGAGGGNPGGSFGMAGGRGYQSGESREQKKEVARARARKQGNMEDPWAVGSRPNQGRTEWEVVDIWGDETRVDREHVVSRHATRPLAKETASKRGERLGVATIHRDTPGPFFADSAGPYTTDEEQN